MDSLPEVLIRMNRRLDSLENRVSLLEHPSETPAALPAPTPLQFASPAASPSIAEAGATFPVFGKAMLGMAGAYVLRAIAESGSFPRLAVAALAIAYAAMWLVWAARIPVRAWLVSTTYAATSALILAPMLWELTLRFKVLTPTAAACVLGMFALAACALAWKLNLVAIVRVATLTTVLAAIALLIATHDMLPFLGVLLLLALVSEVPSARGRWLSIRPIVAAAADFAVCSLIYIYAAPDTSRTDYITLSPTLLLAPGLLLLLIYGASVALRTVLLRQTITLFEAGQAVIAFLLAADSVLHFGPVGSVTAFGIFCLLLSPACYAAVFLCFDRMPASRNSHVYATWGLGLFLAGSFLWLPPHWLASSLGMAAIVATILGAQRSRLTLEFHGLIYLVAAASASGLLQYSAHALAGAFPGQPTGQAWIVAASAILCYAIDGQFQGAGWMQRLFQTLSATLAVGAVATALVTALVWLTATVITPGESHVAVIRTLTACALALALAFFGPRWQRAELLWITYAALAFVAAKLLFEDLRQGHPEFIAASIFLYAVTLILVPQLARISAKTRPAVTPIDR